MLLQTIAAVMTPVEGCVIDTSRQMAPTMRRRVKTMRKNQPELLEKP